MLSGTEGRLSSFRARAGPKPVNGFESVQLCCVRDPVLKALYSKQDVEKWRKNNLWVFSLDKN